MRLVRAVVVGVAVATVAVQSASSPHVLSTALDRPQLRTALVDRADALAVPDAVSFDDLGPSTAAAIARRPPAGQDPAVAPARLVGPPRGGAHGSNPRAGTPQAVLASAYRLAVDHTPRGCHLDVAHLAAIGQVESGSIGGRSVAANHRVVPAIYGPLLDGGPFAVIRDSDDGAIDGATDFDRAVGPLQFLPGTWSWAGRDGDGDGRRDPQNVFDAARATADYLCGGGRDLSRSGDLRSAVLSYNQSTAYCATVVEWVAYFRSHGLAALTTVAFRVGSGGRASDLAVPTTGPKPPAATAVASATVRPSASAARPATPGGVTTTATSTPLPTTTTPPPAVTQTPTPDPTPEPTQPPPAEPTPQPTPEPTPEPTVPTPSSPTTP